MDELSEMLSDDRLTLAGLLFEISTALRIDLERSLEPQAGLSLSGFEVLLRLSRNDPNQLRLSDLALQTKMTRSGLTRVVDSLEESGYVERTKCPSDKRGTFAALTTAGRAVLLRTIPDHLQLLEDALFSQMEPTDRDHLERILRKIRDNVHPSSTSGLECP